MELVTAFESSTPEQTLSKTVESKFLFKQLEGVITRDLQVAETVFARCAKWRFKSLVQASAKYMLSEEGVLVRPLYVASAGVTLNVVDTLDICALEELVEGLARQLPSEEAGKALLLVGALSTKISEVGDSEMTFSVKQKWGFA